MKPFFILTFWFVNLVFIIAQSPAKSDSLSIKMDGSVHEMLDSICQCHSKTPPTVTPMKKDFCRDNVLVNGFKIQLIYTQSKNAAEEVLTQAQSDFPSLFAQIKYQAPEYKVWMGDYFNPEHAQHDLNLARKKYPTALLVKTKVRCHVARENKELVEP